MTNKDIIDLTELIIATTLKELMDADNDDLMQDLLLEAQEAY